MDEYYDSEQIRQIYQRNVDDIYRLCMLKSESMDMGQGRYMLTDVSNPDVGYGCAVYMGAFKESVDISLIDGIELDGVYYPLGL